MSGFSPKISTHRPDRRPVLAVTPGEPAGIGPELAVALFRESLPARIVLIGDPDLLRSRGQAVGVGIVSDHIEPIGLITPSEPGRLDVRNAAYVISTLERAVRGCLDGEFDALITGPVHKGILNEAGYHFSGHTEFLAQASGVPLPVMLLVAGTLRVALVTTHLPLREVPDRITAEYLSTIIGVLHEGLRSRFRIAAPRIHVLGLNPHAGEGGYLGREEIDVIAPAIEDAVRRGWRVRGPVPADTAFTPEALSGCDAILAMYHDQGLPVLKQRSFGEAVNVTLGLPFLRTSVDHGTALSLAGTGHAHSGSFKAAARLALSLLADVRPLP